MSNVSVRAFRAKQRHQTRFLNRCIIQAKFILLPVSSDLCNGSVGNMELTALRTTSSGLLTLALICDPVVAVAAVVVDVVRLSTIGDGMAPALPLDFRCFLLFNALPDSCCSLWMRTGKN